MGSRGQPAGWGWGWRGGGPMGLGGITYLLRDEFTDTRAAGSVNGTAATPGPGTRVVVDANSKLSIGGGVLSIATGGAGTDEPRLSYGSIARLAGRVLIASATITTEGVIVGMSDANTATRQSAIRFYDTSVAIDKGSASWLAVGAYSTATAYQIAIVERGGGEYVFIKGGAFATWTLLFADANGAGDPLYPIIGADDSASVYTLDYIRIPDALFLPDLLAYDTFARANGALGSSETTGPESQVVTARTWESGGATWAIASNEAVNTPTQGADLLAAKNGDFSAWVGDDPSSWTVTESPATTEISEVGTGEGHGGVGSGMCNIYRSGGGSATDPIIRQAILTPGNWYRVEITVDMAVSGILQIYGIGSYGIPSAGAYVVTGRATLASLWLRTAVDPADITFDNVVCKQLTLNTLFTDVDDAATSDVYAQVELDTVVANTLAGLVLNLDDKDMPANFVIAYHDGTNAVLEKCVAGTYTTVINAVVTYAAGANLVVVKEGTSYSLFYNNAKIGATSTIGDAGIISNTKHGLFSTYSGNQLDNFLVMPRGTGGEYADLDLY